MQNANDHPRSFRDRVRSNAREILLAMALTLGAVGFMVAGLVPGNADTGNPALKAVVPAR
jgi:phage-related minor tail protein